MQERRDLESPTSPTAMLGFMQISNHLIYLQIQCAQGRKSFMRYVRSNATLQMLEAAWCIYASVNKLSNYQIINGGTPVWSNAIMRTGVGLLSIERTSQWDLHQNMMSFIPNEVENIVCTMAPSLGLGVFTKTNTDIIINFLYRYRGHKEVTFYTIIPDISLISTRYGG